MMRDIWAITTRMDPCADTVRWLKNTPIDYPDFASPVSGWVQNGAGCHKQMAGRTQREWVLLLEDPGSYRARIDA